MGFFEGLTRLVKGEPVFQPGDSPQDGREHTHDHDLEQLGETPDQARQSPKSEPAQAGGPKVLPQVRIEEIDCRENGANMSCWAIIRNESQTGVEVDKVRMLNGYREVDRHLRPGEKNRFEIYNGPRPTNDYNKDCYLVYKDETGDYFETRHMLEFERMHDNTYTVRNVHYTAFRDI